MRCLDEQTLLVPVSGFFEQTIEQRRRDPPALKIRMCVSAIDMAVRIQFNKANPRSPINAMKGRFSVSLEDQYS
jgi:hypothetical protein